MNAVLIVSLALAAALSLALLFVEGTLWLQKRRERHMDELDEEAAARNSRPLGNAERK